MHPLTLADSPVVEAHFLQPSGLFPNNPDLPLLVYRGVLVRAADPAEAFEHLFARAGWGGGWRNGIYGYHHYHATAHEALGIAAGHVTVQLGGDGGLVTVLKTGDLVVVPAGVAHRNLDASAHLLVVGAYPAGQSPDMHHGRSGEQVALEETIRHLPRPDTDPLYGPDGPLMRLWDGAPAP